MHPSANILLIEFRSSQVHNKLNNTHLALMHFSWAMDLDPKGANTQIKDALDPTLNRASQVQFFFLSSMQQHNFPIFSMQEMQQRTTVAGDEDSDVGAGGAGNAAAAAAGAGGDSLFAEDEEEEVMQVGEGEGGGQEDPNDISDSFNPPGGASTSQESLEDVSTSAATAATATATQELEEGASGAGASTTSASFSHAADNSMMAAPRLEVTPPPHAPTGSAAPAQQQQRQQHPPLPSFALAASDSMAEELLNSSRASDDSL